MSVKIFLSTVSDEFRPYRDQLRTDLTRHNVEVKVQDDFVDLGGNTLDKLDTYIAHCDAVVHLVGDMLGSETDEGEQRALLAKYPNLADELPPLGEALKGGVGVSYTQWEAWLALYHGKLLLIAKAEETALRAPDYAPTAASRGAQMQHLARLEAIRRYPGCAFASPADLAKHIAYTAILDLLVKDYAEAASRAREVAEGFIHEMAKKVAGDRKLDFDGMKRAVRNAIKLYETEIAGRQPQTNIDAIVDVAITNARALVDAGKSGLARATLRKASEAMRLEEEGRRERYIAGVEVLYSREIDIAFAVYNGEAAAEAIIAWAEAIHDNRVQGIRHMLREEARELMNHGCDAGNNAHLEAGISLYRHLLGMAVTAEEAGTAEFELGSAHLRFGRLGGPYGRGVEHLEAAARAFRAALEEKPRELAPLDWATAKHNLGRVLLYLDGTAHLEEAVCAFREALEVRTRYCVPEVWAETQSNLGDALFRLGERERGTERLKEAISAYREVLEDGTRDRMPFIWKRTLESLKECIEILDKRERT